jgi:hypothetical protein
MVSKLAHQEIPILERLFQIRMVCAGLENLAMFKCKFISQLSKVSPD